jgi:hypothetical protein
MEGRCQCKAGCDPHAVKCQFTWWYSGMSPVSPSNKTWLIGQRRKIESDALKMREFLAEGDVSHTFYSESKADR